MFTRRIALVVALLVSAALPASSAVSGINSPFTNTLINALTPGGNNSIPLRCSDNGDGTCSLTTTGGSGGGSTGSPFSGTADAQAPAAAQSVGNQVFNGTTWDRLRSSAVGVSIGGGSVGVLGIQGVTGGVPVPVSGSFTTAFPFSGTSDAQASAAGQNSGHMGYNGATWDQIRVSVVGTSIGAGVPGILGIQGVTGGVAVPVSGSFSTTFPMAGNADAQAAAAAQGTALLGYNGTTWDRLKTASVGASAVGTGILAVQGTAGGTNLNVNCVVGCAASTIGSTYNTTVPNAANLAVTPLQGDPTGNLSTNIGGRYRTFFSAQVTNTIVKTTPGVLRRIINTNTLAQSVVITCYDSINGAGATAATLVYSAQLGASQVIDLQQPLANGLVCLLNSAAAGNIMVNYD